MLRKYQSHYKRNVEQNLNLANERELTRYVVTSLDRLVCTLKCSRIIEVT